MDHSRIARLMGHLWSPVAVVTSQWQGKPNGQIAVAIGAASIVPSMPRVIVQIYKRNYSHGLIYGSGAFAVNFLRQDQLDLITGFGLVSGRDHDKLSKVPYELKSSGSPVLQDCWGYLDCRVVNAMDAGDMTCFLGEVIEGDTITEGEPLWWRDATRRLPPQVMAAWMLKIGKEIQHSMSRMGEIDYTPWQPGGQPH
ncbi:MAG: flavin reductase family protein [Dehalococcoidia bacterium]|nr:flavin reductase family protein [Dehalococcoidia bacterium]